MRILFLLLGGLLLSLPLSSGRYTILHPDKFPIGMWVTPPDSFRTDFQYKKMAESGLTFVNGFAHYENTPDEVVQALDLSERHNLLYFVNRKSTHYAILKYNQLQSVPEEFVNGLKPFATHPAFAGELLIDEPGKPLMKSVAAFVRSFEANFSDKMWHVNLFPTYATGGIQTHSYDDYIDTWLAEVKPPYLSYDSYPLLTNGEIIDDYYFNLDLVRSKALKAGIPFWTFIQTLSISQTPGVPDKREPSREDIRWQVWSNLALGAKGIQYFCYWTPGSATEVFTDAMIDRNGNETVRYQYVKELNSEVQVIGRKLLKSDPVGVIQTAARPYSLYDEALKSFGPVKALKGDDHIAGCFFDENKNVQLLLTPLQPDEGAEIEVLLKNEKGTVKVTQGTVERKMKYRNGGLKFRLNAGDAVLVELPK
ncbi:MAG: beta-galactosidase [Paludibacter sp.]|jgi:hypothetical protein|nr:beta-galactosidase [Paludibacter sp.]